MSRRRNRAPANDLIQSTTPSPVQSAAELPKSGPFQRAIVQEVLGDLSFRSPEDLNLLAGRLGENYVSIYQAPRNSILCKIVTGPGSNVSTSDFLCYPFFPPHFSMPLKPGEYVWIMTESGEGTSKHGYWMSRIHEPDFVDDVNFTHGDRRNDLWVDKVKLSALARIEAEDDTFEFDGTIDGTIPGPPHFLDRPQEDAEAETTAPLTESQERESAETAENDRPTFYDYIYTGSLAMQQVTMEAVPRFTKRPGDLVLQGSNNSLICLGQDRGWTSAHRPNKSETSNAWSTVSEDGVADNPPPEYAGTIDIVTGRGRFYQGAAGDPAAFVNEGINDCQPRVILNTRGKLEVDKNPSAYASDKSGAGRGGLLQNRFDRAVEGDPDFLSDASRIYVSMKTSGDQNFGIPVSSLYPAHVGTLEDKTGPFIVMKSDEIRIIARKDDERGPDGPINGSIRIIKEGTVGDDQASIYLLPEGVVQVSGSRVYIGQPNAGGGEGAGASEPWIKYSSLHGHLSSLYEAINRFCDSLTKHSTPGHGAPSPEICSAAAALSTFLGQHAGTIPSLRSSRIYGE